MEGEYRRLQEEIRLSKLKIDEEATKIKKSEHENAIKYFSNTSRIIRKSTEHGHDVNTIDMAGTCMHSKIRSDVTLVVV